MNDSNTVLITPDNCKKGHQIINGSGGVFIKGRTSEALDQSFKCVFNVTVSEGFSTKAFLLRKNCSNDLNFVLGLFDIHKLYYRHCFVNYWCCELPGYKSEYDD